MSTQSISTKQKHSAERAGSATMLAILIFVVLLAYLPMLLVHYQVLWRLQQYQYFPFIIVAVAYMGWTRWNEASLVDQDHSEGRFRRTLRKVGSPTCAFLALVTFAIAVYCQWGWFAAVSLNLLAAAGLLLLTKHFHIRNVWGIWCLMWLVVPPPIEFGMFLVNRLQFASSAMGSQILDLIGVDHLMEGNVFTLPTKQLFVDEACSGIISVMSVIAATGIYAVWKDRSLFHAFLLLLISVGWATVMNTVRIVSIAIAETNFGINLADGSAHEVLGLALFSMTFIASMSTDQFLEFLLIPIEVVGGDSAVRHNPLVRTWNWLASQFVPQDLEPNAEPSQLNRLLTSVLTPKLMMVAGPVGLIGVWSTLVFFGVVGGKPISRVDALALANSVRAETLPKSIGGWEQKLFETQKNLDGSNIIGFYDFGEFSNTFTYENRDNVAHVSMDYPFTGGWHELTVCYTSRGWNVESRATLDEDDRKFVETTLSFPDRNQHGYLLFHNFHENGDLAAPPSKAILFHAWLLVRRRFLRKVAGDLYQAQVFVTSDSPFTEAEKQEIRSLFFSTEQKLRSYVATVRDRPPTQDASLSQAHSDKTTENTVAEAAN